jgi:ribosome-binding factor A
MPHRFSRSKRVADLLKREMAQMLMGEIKDPRVQGLVTVMAVEVSEDLCQAKVFISVMGSDEERASAIAGINKAKGFVRKTLGSRIGLRRVPELQFQLDRSLENREKIEALLAEIRGGEREAN